MCSRNLSKIFFILFLFLFLFSSKNVFATSPQIVAFPSTTIGLDQIFTISATMSGLSKNAVYRLRLALAQSGTSNYFGSTWSGANWYNGTPSPINYADFLTITTDATGAWWGNMQGEVDADDPNFTTGNGTYDVKVGRYTQTGSSATWSDPVNIIISIPPQPTDTPVPPTPTSLPSPTHAIGTTISQQISAAPTIRPLSTPTSMLSPTTISSFGAVLGTGSAISPTIENKPTLIAAVADHRKKVLQILPLLVILVGFGLLGSCGILIALQTEKGKTIWKRFF